MTRCGWPLSGKYRVTRDDINDDDDDDDDNDDDNNDDDYNLWTLFTTNVTHIWST